jgi:GNAT superfamily N-acetyltransferase
MMMTTETSLETEYRVSLFTPELQAELAPLYADFTPKAVPVYHWHEEPKSYEDFCAACETGKTGATLIYRGEEAIGFWLYVFPGHGALEVCAFYLKDDVKAEAAWVQQVTQASFKLWFELEGWSDFSFGIYGRECETLAPYIEGLHVGNGKELTLADQHIMQRPILFEDTPELLKRYAAPPYPYAISGARPKHREALAEAVAEAFKTEPDAQWDSRFRDIEGAIGLLKQMREGQFGFFHENLSQIVLDTSRRETPVGAAFVIQPELATVNIPLLFIHPEHQKKGLSKVLLLNLLKAVMKARQTGEIQATFINATTNPAQFSAYHIYEELGFTLFDKGFHAYFKDED